MPNACSMSSESTPAHSVRPGPKMERRTGTYRWAIAMVVVGCLVLSSPSAHAAASVHNHAQDLSTSDDQAIDLTRADETVRQETATTDDLTAQFTAAYRSAKPEERRALYDHYLDRLGAPALLDVLEDTHRFCHREGHPLGHAIFAQSQDLAMALRVCGNRCNKGCSHGVLEAAFGDSSFQTIATEMEQFCHQDNVTQIHGPGNCAHAVGHALFKSADHDAEQALTACAALAHPGMGYYCATGVFMEYYDRTRTQKMSRPRSQNLHFPCDTLRYPAACYRYEAWRMLRAPGYNLQVLARECLSLSGARRLGVFMASALARYSEFFDSRPCFLTRARLDLRTIKPSASRAPSRNLQISMNRKPWPHARRSPERMWGSVRRPRRRKCTE